MNVVTEQPHNRVWVFSSGAQRVADGYRSVAAQPNWVVRVALITFFLFIAVPILLLLLFATLAAMFVFALGITVHWVASKVRGVLPRDDGRENVRVIQRTGERTDQRTE